MTVTEQPREKELANLLDMVNPETSDWPPPPHSDGYGFSNPHCEPKEKNTLAMFRATVAKIIGDCLWKKREVGTNVKLPGQGACGGEGGCKDTKSGRGELPLVKNVMARDGGESGRRVKFKSVPEVRVKSCPTLP